MSTMPENAIEIEGISPDDVIPPRELHHVTFKTNRLEEMVAFYAVLTGHQPMFHGDAFAAISFDSANHRIALRHHGWPELPAEDIAAAAGLHHVGYEYGSTSCCTPTYGSSGSGSSRSGR